MDHFISVIQGFKYNASIRFKTLVIENIMGTATFIFQQNWTFNSNIYNHDLYGGCITLDVIIFNGHIC